jgi:hypothetical protein
MSAVVYSDPSRLFRIRLPEGFRRDESAGGLVFRREGLDGAVTVSCLRHRTQASATELFDALPGRESMDNVAEEERDGMSVHYGDYEGELQNRPEAWRWWALQRGPVAVVVSFNGSPEHAEQYREDVDAFVDGLEITERPPISMEDFTALAAEVYARSLNKPKPAVRKPLELAAGENSVLRLDNAYISYLNEHTEDPDADAEVLLSQWLERLWGENNEKLGAFDDVRSLLYPVVKPWGFARQAKVPVLRRVLLEGELELLVALDTGRTLRFLNPDDLSQWEGVSEEDVFFYARENLLALAEELQMQALAGADGTPKAVIIAIGDSYDASRVMLPGLYERLSQVLGEELLVGLPNRDFLIVLSADDGELVSNVAAQVRVDAETRPYPISGKLYRLTATGLAQP